jgi:lipid-binding SYLF domain-containing protein
MLEGNFKFSGNVGGTAGTLGAHAEVDSKAAPVFVYRVGSEGLFAGAHVKGSRFSLRQDVNKQVYGEDFNARDVLQGKESKNSQSKPYIQALKDFSPPAQQKG